MKRRQMNRDERAYVANYIYVVTGHSHRFIPYDYFYLTDPAKLRDYAYLLLEQHGWGQEHKSKISGLRAVDSFYPGGGRE